MFQELQDQYEAIMRGKTQVDAMLNTIQKYFKISLKFEKVSTPQLVKLQVQSSVNDMLFADCAT